MNPILPPSRNADKTGTWPIVRRAEKEVRARFSRYARELSAWVNALDVPVGQYNAEDSYYYYQLDAMLLGRIDDELDRLRIEILLERNPATREHFISTAATMGYEQGTGKAVDNLMQITDDEYPRVVQFVLSSSPYRDRIQYISSRAFEDFEGFTNEMKADLRRVLTDGMANGKGPREIARQVRKRVGVSTSRALRIARTEVTTAHRRAIWDEDRAANGIGIRTSLLHVSALIPGRTRLTHAKKHGHVWDTTEALGDWYAVDGNGINCLCTQVSTLIDAQGKPSSWKLIKKMRDSSKKYVDAVGSV